MGERPAYAVRREPRRGRGIGTAIFIVLVVLAVLAVGLDFGLRFWAQRWLSSRLEQELELQHRPEVSLGGFPFLVQVARARFSRVTIELRDVPADGLTIQRVKLSLSEVGFARGDLVTAGEGAFHVGSGTGEAVVAEEALDRYLGEQGIPVDVELRGPGIRASSTIQVGGQEATASAVGGLSLEDGALVFEPRRVRVEGSFGVPPAALAFRLDLPRPFEGVRYREANVRTGELALQVVVRDSLVRAGG